MAKTKIAILGGGMAALTAAFELSDTQELRDRYDVTIYQMGWRLGGKCASGRDPSNNQRVEEHGLHVWFGFYENAFALIQRCYAEFNPSPNNPIKTWRDALKPQVFTPIGDEFQGKLTYWPVEFPTNDDTPGDGEVLLTPWGAITEFLNIIKLVISHAGEGSVTFFDEIGDIPPLIESLFAEAIGDGVKACESLLHRAVQWAESFGGDHETHPGSHHDGLSWLLTEFKKCFYAKIEKEFDSNPDLHRIWHVVDIGIAIVIGILNPKYRILETENLNVIDDYELRAWMLENGGTSDVINNSHELRALYDTCFAYDRGDLNKPNFAAGTAVRVILRILTTYKEAVMFEMQGGMGDVVISPIYEVLQKRGVKVALFHKVKKLTLTGDKNDIAQIHIGVQAKAKSGAYQPTYDVKGLSSWPSHPLWDQLVDGDKMSAANVNFESNWCQWPDAEPLVLEAGKHFDKVVLGLSLGAFKKLNAEATICDELTTASQKFRDMTTKIGIVPTQAAQLWVTKNLLELGWKDPKPAFVAGPETLDIWADMSQIIAVEDWPGGKPPGSLHYFCGVLPTDLFEAPTTDATVPAKALTLVQTTARDWFGAYTKTIWPNAIDGATGGLDYNVLVADNNVHGVARLNAQFLRANVDPTECCVTSLAGTTKYRLDSDESGFTNLYLTGDWIRTGMNAACVEGAVMSGMQAARAISGDPIEIVGEDFFQCPIPQ